jgi:hypothetical protein
LPPVAFRKIPAELISFQDSWTTVWPETKQHGSFPFNTVLQIVGPISCNKPKPDFMVRSSLRFDAPFLTSCTILHVPLTMPRTWDTNWFATSQHLDCKAGLVLHLPLHRARCPNV